MRIAWGTDLHLNFLSLESAEGFAERLASAGPDAVVLTGDLAEATSLELHLGMLERVLARPVYFVLGNHDCYRGSIKATRELARGLSRASRWLRWLPDAGVITLAPGLALAGHDGWSDARCGDWERSTVVLSDYFYIDELSWITQEERRSRLHALGDEAATYARGALSEALSAHARVLFATHVPPFREACWHEGRISDDHWLPHFTCKAMGDAMLEVFAHHPGRRLTVLCGHTHGEGVTRPLPGMVVHTGKAEYGAPDFSVLDTDTLFEEG